MASGSWHLEIGQFVARRGTQARDIVARTRIDPELSSVEVKAYVPWHVGLSDEVNARNAKATFLRYLREIVAQEELEFRRG